MDQANSKNFGVLHNSRLVIDLKILNLLKSIIAVVKEIFCTFKVAKSINTCRLNDIIIDSEKFILGSPYDSTVKSLYLSGNKEVKFLPKHIGEKLPNLIEVWVSWCSLTVISNHYFERMKNVKDLVLYENEIKTIEPNAFKDLVSVEALWLNTNSIETLDKNLFASMVKLESIFLEDNQLKVLSPETFKIPNATLRKVNLSRNICLNGFYGLVDFDQMELVISIYCK